MIVIVLLLLALGGLAALAVIEPRPPQRHFEITVPNDRFAR